MDELAASGQPVFVDFTAAWCVTCQYNKKTHAGATTRCWPTSTAKNVALLRADWTRRDPAITAALARAGPQRRAGLCAPRPGKAPVVLSEVLGVEEVRSADRQPVGVIIMLRLHCSFPRRFRLPSAQAAPAVGPGRAGLHAKDAGGKTVS